MQETNRPELERVEIHRRTIEMIGYRLADGLFEIEATLVDTKPFNTILPLAQDVVPAGDAIHDLSLTLTFDEDMVVTAVRTRALATPYRVCRSAGEGLQTLVGLSMSRGWNSEVRHRLARSENCTHFVGLLAPMATTAFQAIGAVKGFRALETDENGRPRKLDSCYAYAGNREIVQRAWPEFFTGQGSKDSSGTKIG